LKSPTRHIEKQCILSAFSQIIGALYESEREGHLKVELLHNILSGAINYLFQNYRIDEIREIFICRLKESKYVNPLKKIEIPDRYSEKTQLQTEGICWIINRFLE
jgi:hypothetical protein